MPSLSWRDHLLIMLVLSQTAQAAAPMVMSKKDLMARMRQQTTDADACFRLLYSNGAVGCASTGAIKAPVRMLNSSGTDVTEDSVVLIGADDRDAFLTRLAGSAELQRHVKGVLVDATTGNQPSQESSAATNPAWQYAPEPRPGYQWNPAGSAVARLELDVPVMLLGSAAAADAQTRAQQNARQAFKGAVHHARLESAMWGADNSSACIQSQTCLPLGGHSVWAAVPPLRAGAPAKQIVLALAPIDSAAFFRSKAVGAESAMGSMIALLVAAQVLGNNSALTSGYRRQVVLAALAGETWDYMGSRRLLWEMANAQNSTEGLQLEQISQVIELGQVGLAQRAGSQGIMRFFAHTERGGSTDKSQVVQALQQAAGASPGELQATVQLPSNSTPGIPPASLSSFLRMKPSLAGAVLADYDAHFRNRFFESEQDTADNVDLDSLAAAAVLLARALHQLAAADGSAPLKVDTEAVRSQVAQLVACLLQPLPGLQCSLAQRLVSPTQGEAVAHYIGDLRTLSEHSQQPEGKSTTARFIWGLLATFTGLASPDAPKCDFSSDPCPTGQACVATGPQGQLRCQQATVKYVPSYSTKFECQDCKGDPTDFRWNVTTSADSWEQEYGWPPDSMWAESIWPAGQPAFALFQRQSPTEANIALIIGVVVTLCSIAGAIVSKVLYERQLKSQ